MEVLKLLDLAISDARRAERLTSDARFRASLRRYPMPALRMFATAYPQPVREATLGRVERILLLDRIA